MATLAGKKIVVVGGSSGIGYGVAKASLLSLATHVIIASSSRAKVDAAVARLLAELTDRNVQGMLSGEVVDAKDSGSVKALFAKVGEIDHLVWTSGDALRTGSFKELDLDKNKDVLDVRFWGAAVAAQAAAIREGGSITFTIGSVIYKPHSSMTLVAGMIGAVDSFTRGLAVSLAPIRVNAVSPGTVKTELWDPVPTEIKERRFEDAAKTLLVRHVGEPDEIAEAYLFLMKCTYITGQRIEVDGGRRLI